MTAPLLSDLREPPTVGRFYMVPVVKAYPWHGRVADWPVIGPKHEDAEIFNFPHQHYHIDPRFLSARYARSAVSIVPWQYANGEFENDLGLVASIYPLVTIGVPLPNGRPALKRLQCRRSTYTTTLRLHFGEARDKMTALYGNPAEPIRLADGRLLCPHRKVDLSQFPPDSDGVVTCPVHGLRVRCAAARPSEESDARGGAR